MESEDADSVDSVLRVLASAPSVPLRAHPTLGERFALRRCLGSGGFGVVYEAEDVTTHDLLALKVLRQGPPDRILRFKREFRALQGLAHPNLVTYGDLYCVANEWFFTMELVDGTDLLSYVRKSPGAFDEQRLRGSLRQLLLGLQALHVAGKVHRDVKPSNVRVTGDGRLVLLDFGLVTDSEAADHSGRSGVVGTPIYMAPEQAASAAVGPPADLYAVGVLLYELLTGRAPIEGSPLQILMNKQTQEPPPASALVAGVPPDLDDLCSRLLRFEPGLRPDAGEALRRLSPATSDGLSPPRKTSDAPPFVGRAMELSLLRAAAQSTASGDFAAVLFMGESGIGKSSLVRRFTDQFLVERPEAMILEGRCYQRETVPYKTFDGIVDVLSRRLSRIPSDEIAGLLPTRCAELAQVFPVMLRVPQIAAEYASRAKSADAHELRQRAFSSLRELLTRISLRMPTVIAMDDLQWADEDGLRVFGEVFRASDAPPLLFVGAARVTGDGVGAPVDRLRELLLGRAQFVQLTALGHDEAIELAKKLLLRAGVQDNSPERIAQEAQGHPLFVEELIRQLTLGRIGQDDVKLDEAIWSRVLPLGTEARVVAELVAVAGQPLPHSVLAAAARVELSELTRCTAMLRAANLMRASGTRWPDSIEPYHDRVREAILARLDDERRRSRHQALAIAFEASQHGEPETLAVHWREARNPARAALYSAAAAEQASRTYAFERAAQWYQQAVELLPVGHADSRALRIKLGEALANAGRGALAAPQFEAAADDAPPSKARELRRLAAEQFFRSGRYDRGLEASRAVLREIGMRLPSGRMGTILAILYYRSILFWRGLKFRERDGASLTEEATFYLDTCWSVGYAVICIDPLVGHIFCLRSLLLALRAGDLERIIRGMVSETVMAALPGGRAWRRTARLIEHTMDLAHRCGGVTARYFATHAKGIALYLNGRFRAAAESLDAAQRQAEESPTGLTWERIENRAMLIMALVPMGRYREVRQLQAEGLRDAQARGDLWASVSLRVADGNVAWLVEDRPDIAETHLQSAIQEWSTRGFHTWHFAWLRSRILVCLYAGDADAAYALSRQLLRRARRSLLWPIQIARVNAHHMHAACALAMLSRNVGHRPRLMRSALRSARAIERERTGWSDGFVAAIRAAVAFQSGDASAALANLESAIRLFEKSDIMGYAAAARDRAARVRSDSESEREIETVAQMLRMEEVVSPERFVGMLLPGFEHATGLRAP
jgi:tetratricopeptide (TPR) repeat protein